MEAAPRSSASFSLSLVSSLIGHSEILASPRHNDCLPAPLRRDTKKGLPFCIPAVVPVGARLLRHHLIGQRRVARKPFCQMV